MKVWLKTNADWLIPFSLGVLIWGAIFVLVNMDFYASLFGIALIFLAYVFSDKYITKEKNLFKTGVLLSPSEPKWLSFLRAAFFIVSAVTFIYLFFNDSILRVFGSLHR